MGPQRLILGWGRYRWLHYLVTPLDVERGGQLTEALSCKLFDN